MWPFMRLSEAHMIVKMADAEDRPWYFIWSGMWDAPITKAMTLKELRRWCLREAVQRAERELAQALVRVDQLGISSHHATSVKEAIEPCNRAGKGDTWLTAEQQLELVLRWREDPEAAIEGVPQDMVCCGCSTPIATEAERTWSYFIEGEGVDPLCGTCAAKRRPASR
jgi:hypothetical protein